LFVLAAGIAGVNRVQFVTGVTISRGLRYFALGLLTVYYGDVALEMMRTRGREVALWVVGLILFGALTYWLLKRRGRRDAV
jgi:membrane protein DedA with SNARE-associated domain